MGYKSQGATIVTKVVMDINGTFTLGLTYVMVFRVRNQNNLNIIGNLIPNDFIPCNFLKDYYKNII
jgi:hypothetical protein